MTRMTLLSRTLLVFLVITGHAISSPSANAAAPLAVDDSKTTPKNTPVDINVLSNDTADIGASLAANTVKIVRPFRRGIFALRNGQTHYSPLPDFVGTDTFKYTVQDDLGNISNQATVTVTINGAPTDISLSADTLAENQSAGTAIGTFSSTDLNVGDTHTYTLVFGTGATDNASFQIVSGALQSAAPLDYETKSVYSIRVRSTDSGGLSFEKVFTVNLTDVNEAPTVDTMTFSVAENSANGTSVGTVTASDVDSPAQTLTYAITAGNTGNAFTIDTSTGVISVQTASALNFEAQATYTLTVQATDDGTPNLNGSATITVNLTNANDAPTVTTATFSVAENSANGTSVGTVTASDVDSPAQTLTYAITAGNTGNAFTINSNTGAISVQTASALNFEAQATYTLTVQATDDGTPNLNGSATITVNLTNVNEAPLAVDDAATVNEGGTVTALTTPTAATTVKLNDSDPDAGNILSVTTAPVSAPAHGTLTLNSNGTFSYTHDSSETVSDSFVYEICDSALCDTATVNITITPVNDNPTVALSVGAPDVIYDSTAATPVLLDAAATVGDVDSPDFSGGVLSADVTTNCEADDRLGVRDEGIGLNQISVSGATVSYNFGSGPVAIGTIATEFNCATPAPTTLTVSLNGSATPAATQALLRNITYSSNAALPAGTLRGIAVVLTDGDGGTSNSVSKTLNIDASPEVDTISPADAAVDIAIDSNVVITFSETVDVSGNWFQIDCPTSGNRTALSGTVISGGPTVYTINPDTNFANGEACTVTVTATQVADQDTIDPPDNMTADFTSTFTTIDIAPRVTSTTPTSAAITANNQTVTLNFSESVNVAAGAISWNCGGAIAFTPALPQNGVTSLTLTPSGALPNGASCSIALESTLITDADNIDSPNELDGNNDNDTNDGDADDFTLNFTVDAAPILNSTTPSDGASDISVNGNIVLTFSEMVNATTGSFTLNCGGDVTYTLSGSGTNAITLDPSADLPGATTCTVSIIGANVSDSDAFDPPNTMTAGTSFSFTTQPIAVDDSYNVTPHLTLNVDTGIQNGRVTANDQLGVIGSITGFGTGGSCNATPANGSSAVTTAGGGRVVLAANGSFNYIPPQSAANASDSFCYTVTGNDTATVTFTIANTQLVWFVDAAYAGANGTANGTQGRPFTTLTAAAGIDTADDTIFVKHSASGYACGVTLLANEKLIGEGSGSTLAALSGITPVSGSIFPNLTNNSANWPTLTASTNCVTLATGNTIRGFNFGNVGAANTVLSGTSFGTLALSDSAITTNGRALNLDTGTLAAGSTFSSLSSNGSSNEGIRLSAVAGPLTIGSTSLSNSTLDGIRAMGLSGSWNFGAVNISTTGQTGMYFINGTATAAIQAGSTSISGTGTQGIALQGMAAGSSVTIASATIADTTSEGVFLLNNNSTAVNINGGSVQNANGADFRIDGGAGNMTYAGTITDDLGSLVTVQNTTGGTKTFSGAITDGNDGDGSGITLSSNTNATINFSGGLTLSTGANAAFTATGGSTVNVTGTNTLTTTTGTALKVQSTNIGSNGLTFRSITAGTGAGSSGVGISLDNTGTGASNGGLTVTGTGSAGTGGTIQHKTGADASTTAGIGIFLKDTKNASFSWMQLNDFDNAGIIGRNVQGFTLQNSVINGFNGTNSAAAGDGPIYFGLSNPSGTNGLQGTGLIRNTKISGGIEHNLEFYNQSGSMNLTIEGTNAVSEGANPNSAADDVADCIIEENSTSNGADGIQIEMQGTSTATVVIDRCLFRDNKSQAVQVAANDSSTVTLTIDESKTRKFDQGNEGFILSNGRNGDLTTLVSNNAANNYGGTMFYAGQTAGNASANSLLNATIINNTVTQPASATNHGIIVFLTSDNGINFPVQTSYAKIKIDGNNVTNNSAFNGIKVDTPDSASQPNFHSTDANNSVAVADNTTGVNGIALQARQSSVACFDIGSNTVTFPNGTPAGVSGLRARQVNPATYDLAQSAGCTSPTPSTLLSCRNPAATTEVLGTLTATPAGACLLPATP